MNKHERKLLTKLYWHIADAKYEHPMFHGVKSVLQHVIRGEYKIADDMLHIHFEEAPLPVSSTQTPTCPECGSTRVRIVYKDDDATEVDFYDCTMCSTVFLPTKNIPPNRDPFKRLYEEKENEK